MKFLDEQFGPDCKISYWKHPVFGHLRVWSDLPRFGRAGAEVIYLWRAIAHEQAKIARREARKAERRTQKERGSNAA